MSIVDKVKLVVVRRHSPDVETELGTFPSKDAAMPAFQGKRCGEPTFRSHA